MFSRLSTPIVIGFSSVLMLVSPSAVVEEAGPPAGGIDEEISTLEQKRASDLVFCLQVLVQRGDFARAAELIQDRLVLPPPQPQADILSDLVSEAAFGMLRVSKMPREAAELCDSAGRAGESAVLCYIASLARAEMGEHALSRGLRERAAAIKKDDKAYWFNVASFFSKKNEFDVALEAFETVVASSAAGPTHYDADSEAAMASILCRRGEYDEAQRHCDNLRQIARKIVVSRTSTAALNTMILSARARDEEIEGDYEAAVENYKKAANLSPDPSEEYNLIGRLYLKMKDYPEAEKWFRQAADAGGLAAAFAGLGDLLKAQGKPEKADEEYAVSEKAFAEEIERHPQTASVYNNLAWFYATHDRQLEKGVSLAEKALKIAPEQPEYLDTLAELHYRMGNTADAIRVAMEAIALRPPHIKYYENQLQRFRGEAP